MTVNARVLPSALHEALAVIGQKLTREERIGDELDRALGLMASLSAADVARADLAIADAASLHHRPTSLSSVDRALGLRTNAFDKAELLQTPGLEYLFIFHHDGRLREHALLRMSGGLPNSFLFAAVAWRLNDWAAPVRGAATRCAQRSFPDTAPDIVAGAAVGLLTRLQTWSRWDDERVQVHEAFDRADVAECLADLIVRGRTGALATTLRYALRSSALDGHLERIASDAVQPSVRAAALGTLINRKATWPFGYAWEWVDKSMGLRRIMTAFAHRDVDVAASRNELIARGVRDPSPAVRRVALDGVLRYLPKTAEARDFAALLAADRSPSVRARAAFILR